MIPPVLSGHFLPALVAGILVVALSSCAETPSKEQEDRRPNLLLLVADDLGYADLGCYGGDIATPNIDGLAARGVRFSRFHASPYCAPTRAMLLSGNDNHIAGMGVQSLVTEVFGYEGRLSDRIAIMPEVLRTAGYHTYMAGKWHLGMTDEADPHRRGFEHAFALLPGAGNHYDDQGLFRSFPTSPYTEDGQPARWERGRYSTDFYTDKLIEYIERHRDDDRPFFVYAAYTSPHWPLQVDERYWKKYEGRYDAGYEVLREERLASLKAAGMVPENAVLPPRHPRVADWNSLSPAEQRKEARKMELYAGMVDNLDYNIGRLLQYLDTIGELDNTLIVFMSDNGAAAEDFYYNPVYGPFLQEHFNDAYENMGAPRSFISYGPQWAEAGSAPFRYFKGQVTEGGLIAPMILAGPGVERRGEIHHGLVTLLDIAPSFFEAARAVYPDTLGRQFPLKGRSVLELAGGRSEQVHDSAYVFALEHGGRAMLRKGDWKLVHNDPPFREEQFALYHLPDDLGEIRDLKEAEPEKFAELLKEWAVFAEAIRLQVPPPGAMD